MIWMSSVEHNSRIQYLAQNSLDFLKDVSSASLSINLKIFKLSSETLLCWNSTLCKVSEIKDFTYICYNLGILLDQWFSLIVPSFNPLLHSIRSVIKVWSHGQPLLQNNIIHIENNNSHRRSNLLFKQFGLGTVQRESIKNESFCVSSFCFHSLFNQLNNFLLKKNCKIYINVVVRTSGTGLPWLMIW